MTCQEIQSELQGQKDNLQGFKASETTGVGGWLGLRRDIRKINKAIKALETLEGYYCGRQA